MPEIEKHMELSLKRTGKEYRELHKWINEENGNEKHNILKIPYFLPMVEKKFGKEGVDEYLYHIKEDIDNTILIRKHNFVYRGFRKIIKLFRRK